VDPINSVQLSNHTGYPTVKGQRLQVEDLRELIEGLDANHFTNHYTHLLTGYIGSVSFLQEISSLVPRLRQKNPALIYVCDPVMGDYMPEETDELDDNGKKKVALKGSFYVSKEFPKIFTEYIVPLCDVLLPNQFECELLSGVEIHQLSDAAKACDILHSKGVSKIVITSLHNIKTNHNGIILFGSERNINKNNSNESTAATAATIMKRFTMKIEKIDGHFVGTGDLTASLILAWCEREKCLRSACEKAVSSVREIILKTKELGRKELAIIQCKHAIENPVPHHSLHYEDEN
jgi:pyridoxine kinase